MKNFYILWVVIIVVAIGIFAWLGFSESRQKEVPLVMSFEGCVDAGYEVLLTYPHQCKTPEGLIYTEEIVVPITYENSTSDLIRVELPFPGAVVGKEFGVIGEARGNWFFEASFPIELLDEDGNLLDTGIAQAQGEWMTENFVPFKADISAPDTYTGPATLVFKKDNPSGLPENDASMYFDITVEY